MKPPPSSTRPAAAAPEAEAPPARQAPVRTSGARILIFVAHDNVVRSFLTTGAFEAIDGPQTFLAASSGGVRHEDSLAILEAHPNYLGTVTDPRPETERGTGILTLDYRFLRRMLTVRHAAHSSTMALKLKLMAPRKRRFFRLVSLPWIRRLALAAVFWRTGRNQDVERVMREVEPDLVLVPTGVYDNLAWDALRSARRLGITSLAVVPNWDALSGKAGFPLRPDYIGVWGEQTAEQAHDIHGFARERIELLGAPQFESYIHHTPGSAGSPFDFPYVLFAGTSAPFDELTTLTALDAAIEAAGLDIKIVYRPHPDRRRRKRPDYVDESEFDHIVIDPQVRDTYLAHFEHLGDRNGRPPYFLSLDYYPALLDSAELVICPFSTMIVEAALFDRRVLVPAYQDGIHRDSPAVIRGFQHFGGLEDLDGIDFIDSLEGLVERFTALLRENSRPSRPLRDQIRHYVFFDEHSFSERLAALVERITAVDRSAG